jgi:hypothetical protein
MYIIDLSYMANITLSMKEEKLKKARKYLEEQGSSVNQEIRNHLEKITERPKGYAAQRMQKLADTLNSTHGIDWTREDLHRG